RNRLAQLAMITNQETGHRGRKWAILGSNQ
ncbi:MAG: hypothetical protein QOE01_2679, partial [Actinomycetota bacterium]|nr:hypothetical protein [Actinomycetota bacterium]